MNNILQKIILIVVLIGIAIDSWSCKPATIAKEATDSSNTNTTSQQLETKSESSSEPPLNDQRQKGLNEKGELDLLKIGHLHTSGRMQDKEFHPYHQELVKTIGQHPQESISLLIGKLDDETACAEQPFCYWNSGTIGDLAIGILDDLFTDSNDRSTLSGSDWPNLIGYRDGSDEPFMNAWYDYVERHGRKPIKRHWERLWHKYQDKMYWDEKELCFKVKR
jgi:hypothetical protein